VDLAAFYQPRSINPAGGQWVTSVRDLLSYARFHLGDGLAADGQRVMSLAALRGMWSMPGPGGTLGVELIGTGVSWDLRPTAEGVVVVWHGGDLPGYHSHLMLVPVQRFAIILLTNSDGGPNLIEELFYRNWTLRHFVGLSNLPAPPRRLSASELAQYEGHYVAESIAPDNKVESTRFRLTGRPDGTLQLQPLSSGDGSGDAEDDPGPGVVPDPPPPPPPVGLTFYANDYVINEPTGIRNNFLRDRSEAVVWLRFAGTLFRRRSDNQ
jgi:CubicO group peptidase (beta-lactamase class C family)